MNKVFRGKYFLILIIVNISGSIFAPTSLRYLRAVSVDRSASNDGNEVRITSINLSITKNDNKSLFSSVGASTKRMYNRENSATFNTALQDSANETSTLIRSAEIFSPNKVNKIKSENDCNGKMQEYGCEMVVSTLSSSNKYSGVNDQDNPEESDDYDYDYSYYDDDNDQGSDGLQQEVSLDQVYGHLRCNCPRWASGVSYVAGEFVLRNGMVYSCLQSHEAETNWAPAATPDLWALWTPDSAIPTAPGCCSPNTTISGYVTTTAAIRTSSSTRSIAPSPTTSSSSHVVNPPYTQQGSLSNVGGQAGLSQTTPGTSDAQAQTIPLHWLQRAMHNATTVCQIILKR